MDTEWIVRWTVTVTEPGVPTSLAAFLNRGNTLCCEETRTPCIQWLAQIFHERIYSRWPVLPLQRATPSCHPVQRWKVVDFLPKDRTAFSLSNSESGSFLLMIRTRVRGFDHSGVDWTKRKTTREQARRHVAQVWSKIPVQSFCLNFSSFSKCDACSKKIIGHTSTEHSPSAHPKLTRCIQRLVRTLFAWLLWYISCPIIFTRSWMFGRTVELLLHSHNYITSSERRGSTHVPTFLPPGIPSSVVPCGVYSALCNPLLFSCKIFGTPPNIPRVSVCYCKTAGHPAAHPGAGI